MHSQVNALLTVRDVWLELQPGFVHDGKENGRPTSCFFPFVITQSSKAGILFNIRLVNDFKEQDEGQPESVLNISYGISGDRAIGAHTPLPLKQGGQGELVFKSAIVLQCPVLDPCVSVGFLPFSCDRLRVGQLVDLNWRIERLKSEKNSSSNECTEDALYEVDAIQENWMIAGKKRGHVLLPSTQGSRVSITITCVPLVSGYVRPPQLLLPDIGESNISFNPAGPHLVCVLPPVLSSSFCIPS